MATTLLQFDATSFDGDQVPVTAGDLPAYFDMINGRTCLAFIDGANETAAVTKAVNMPQAFNGDSTHTALLTYFSSASNSTLDLEVYVEAISDGDATDLDSVTSFDTVNSVIVTAPATAGAIDQASVVLTNRDAVVAGDMVRFLVRRDSDDGANDSNTGTMYILSLELRES